MATIKRNFARVSQWIVSNDKPQSMQGSKLTMLSLGWMIFSK